jgi:hypothetical protein
MRLNYKVPHTYYRLFEVGLISDLAVQILIPDAENAEDQYLNMIRAKNFEKYFYSRGFYAWLKKSQANQIIFVVIISLLLLCFCIADSDTHAGGSCLDHGSIGA